MRLFEGEKMWELKRCWWEYKLIHPLWRIMWQFYEIFKNVDILPLKNPTSNFPLFKKKCITNGLQSCFLYIIVKTWKTGFSFIGNWLKNYEIAILWNNMYQLKMTREILLKERSKLLDDY